MTRWSGLAPAVDAHLARWARVADECERLERKMAGRATISYQTENYPIVAAWTVFAQSWGVPQADGTIRQEVTTPDGATINGREQFNPTDLTGTIAAQLIAMERQLLYRAETVYVSAPIVEQVSIAALEMEPEPLFETDLIQPYGLMVLERPIYVPDLHPETGEITDFLYVAIRAVGWMPSRVGRIGGGKESEENGVMLFLYSTADDWKESYRRDLIQAVRDRKLDLGDLTFGKGPTAETLADLERAEPPRWMARLPRDFLFPSDVCPWRFDTPWEVFPRVGLAREAWEQGYIDSTVAYSRRWFLAIMRFCWQRILVRHRERLSPKAAKRIDPIQRKRPMRDYSVLRLRRAEGQPSHETGTGVPLGYRQLVRRHPRRVWYPSLGPARNPDGSFNEASHRLVWIEQFWRGPEDGQIGPLHKATTVVR
ncbi:MAG TPA: hypothetical protein VIX41_11160 [Acidimicrobiales bacterium]